MVLIVSNVPGLACGNGQSPGNSFWFFYKLHHAHVPFNCPTYIAPPISPAQASKKQTLPLASYTSSGSAPCSFFQLDELAALFGIDRAILVEELLKSDEQVR